MKELTIDLNNYSGNDSIFNRTAARGIISRDGKYLIIHSKYGDYKFPGGGMNTGESLTDTLCREVREETGYIVRKDTVSEYLMVTEKRKGCPDDIMLMESYYYFCEVEDAPRDKNMDDYEQEYDYQTDWLPLEEIIERNEGIRNIDNTPWVLRETMVMKELLKSKKDNTQEMDKS